MLGLQMFNEVERFHQDMDQLLCSLGLGAVAEKRREPSGLSLEDKGDRFQVHGPLPGIDLDALEIKVLGRQLFLEIKLLEQASEGEVVWHRKERQRGTFTKNVMLPEDVDAEQVTAEYEKGMLTIVLPKAASALPKKITVKVV